MTDAHVDDEDRLRQVLDRLASASAPRSALGRVIFEGGSGDAMQAVLQAIDETILPRRLIFSSEEDSHLCLDVVERRVVALAQEGLLSATDAQRLAAELESFCARASVVHLRSEITQQAQVTGEVGLSAADLSAHTAGGAARHDVDAEITAALAESAAHALAIVDQAADGSHDEKGQGVVCDKLRGLAAAIDQVDAQPPQATSITIWSGSPPNDVTVLRVVSPHRRIWMALEPSQLDGCVAIWSRVV